VKKITFKIVLLLIFLILERISYSQSDSKILLISTNLECSDLGKSEISNFVRDLNSTLLATRLFKNNLSIVLFKQKQRQGTFKDFCKTVERIDYYFTSVIHEINTNGGKRSYNIDFSLYDINNPNPIPNEILKNFNINPVSEDPSIQNIERCIKREIEYFNQNGNKFRPIIKVEQFSTKSGNTSHTTDFPQWMVKKLMKNQATSRDYNFIYIGNPSDEQFMDSYIQGTLQLINHKNKLEVHFGITVNSNPKDTTIYIYQDYQFDANKNIDPIITSVFDILNKK